MYSLTKSELKWKTIAKIHVRSDYLRHAITIIIPRVIFEEMTGKIKVYMKMQMI